MKPTHPTDGSPIPENAPVNNDNDGKTKAPKDHDAYPANIPKPDASNFTKPAPEVNPADLNVPNEKSPESKMEISLEELITKEYGAPGTPGREQFEKEMEELDKKEKQEDKISIEDLPQAPPPTE